MAAVHRAQVLFFGPFEAHFETQELKRHGIRLRLPRQSFQILGLLLERPGQLITRVELQRALWPSDTFVDFEKGINAAITRLREAIGDSVENPRYIETLSRRGYRFIGTLETREMVAPAPRFTGLKSRALQLSVTAVFATVCIVGTWLLSRVQSKPLLPPLEVMPLVGLPGMEAQPTFSPDGNQVAFALHGKGNSGIYTVMVGGEKPLRLTTNSTDSCPTWSPDGRQIAFSRYSQEGIAIYLIPALGGTEHRLWLGTSTLPPGWASGRSLDWSPDGKFVAFSDLQEDRTHAWISLLSIADSTVRRLTPPQTQSLDYGPAFSPDGSAVAFVRGITSGVVEDLYVVPTAGGEPKRLTFDNAWLNGPPTWTPDGRDIIFSSRRGGLATLWRIPAFGGAPRPVSGAGAAAAFPSISPKGNSLAYQQLTTKNTLWRLNLRDERTQQDPPAVVISDRSLQTSRAQFSPDGKRIVFESDRLGYSEIWACDSDGSNCGQLTSLRGIAGAPQWSPDGQYVAFEYRPKEHSEVYIFEVASGLSRLHTTLPGADNGGPNWSRDGKWIYFYSNRGGGAFQLWKTRVDGGPPVQVTRNGGIFAAESVDGRFLYYLKFESTGIWRMPLNGGEEVRILDRPAGEDWWNWALGRNGIYFVDLVTRTVSGEASPRPAIVKFFDFATREETSISAVPSDKPSYIFGLAVSSDQRSILYDQREYESSIVLVRNFQ